MSFQALETSTHDARPVEFYRFTWGAESRLYTSAAAPQTHPTFGPAEPWSIRRTSGQISKETQQSAITLTVPVDFPIVALIGGAPAASPIHLTIIQGHVGDGEFQVQWFGRVRASLRRGIGVDLTCDPADKVLNRSPLRVTTGPMCHKRLYGARCGALEASHTHEAILTAVAGEVITSPVFGAQANGFWLGAECFVPRLNARVLVVAHAGNDLTLWAEIPGLQAGDLARLIEGCDHLWKRDDGSWGDCHARFGNAINFGGDPWVAPGKNPFKTLE